MSTFKLQTVDNKLIKQNNTVFSSGSVGVDSIQITVDGTWDFNGAEYFFCCESLENGTEGKTELTRNGNILSCEVPIFLTASPAEWEIGIYAEQNARRIKTSTLVNLTVTQGAKTDAADPYAPIRAEAYQQGKAEGYTDGYAFTQQIINWAENNITGSDALNMLIGLGSATHPVDLPFIRLPAPFNPSYTYVKSGYGIRCFGFDFSKCPIKRIDSKLFLNSKPVLQKAVLTGLSDGATSGGWYTYFENCVSIEEIYTDKIAVRNGATGVDCSFGNLFRNCPKLKIIGGYDAENNCVDNDNFGEIDFRRCSTTSNMFSGCSALEEVRFKNNSLSMNLIMSSCSKLSQESVISLINALGTITSTIKMHPDIKQAMETDWWCAFNAGTGLYSITDPETDPTAITFSYAVSAKEWILE